MTKQNVPGAGDLSGGWQCVREDGVMKSFTEKGLWQDIEFVPKIVEKMGG